MKESNYKVFIHQNVMQVFQKYRIPDIPAAGGILLGQIRKNEIYILKVTEPSRWDIRHLFGFVRKKKQAQRAIDVEFEKSEGRTIYLGEWHSHPEAAPTPSSTDIGMIKQQFSKNEINEDFLLMLIVGYNQDFCAIYDGKKLLQGDHINAPSRMEQFVFYNNLSKY